MANSKTTRKKNAIPRFIVQVIDTHTISKNNKGEKSYLNVSAASDKLQDFLKPYTEEESASHTGAKNEFESMLMFFKDDIVGAKTESKSE
jgi:hypothetical protein